MHPNRSAIAVIASLAVLAASWVAAGPLNPPPGPVAPTLKAIDDVEPRTVINLINTPGDADSVYKITQPGSYYLTENVRVIANKNGIEIAASGVTIDLMGFEMTGPGTAYAVGTSVPNLTDIEVRNGGFSYWGAGINLRSQPARNCTITGIRAAEIYGSAIFVGPATTVRDCVVTFGVVGIVAGPGSSVTDCSIYSNYEGILVESGSTVSGCAVHTNPVRGIQASGRCTILDNVCMNNGLGVEVLGTGSRIEGNNCSGNITAGIQVSGTANVIVRNICRNNVLNWSIAAGNQHGPIVDLTAASTPAVSGNSAPDGLGSTHPHANFTY